MEETSWISLERNGKTITVCWTSTKKFKIVVGNRYYSFEKSCNRGKPVEFLEDRENMKLVNWGEGVWMYFSPNQGDIYFYSDLTGILKAGENQIPIVVDMTTIDF